MRIGERRGHPLSTLARTSMGKEGEVSHNEISSRAKRAMKDMATSCSANLNVFIKIGFFNMSNYLLPM